MSMFARIRHAILVVVASAAVAFVAGCGSSSSSNGPAAAPTSSGGLVETGGNWPAPVDQTFQGCPPQGDGGDAALNIRKNRTDTGNWQPTNVSAIVNLAYPQSVVKQARATWSAADTAAVAQSEGQPLRIEGYMLLVRHEGTETPNCHDTSARDFHMWLAGQPGTTGDRASSMIVEVAPRARALNAGWQPDSRLLGLTGHHVRISGWLMLDQEHPEQVGKTRGTLWELHPVMKIEVEQGGQWVDLNDSSLTIVAGSNTISSGTTGSGARPYTTHRRRRPRAHPTPSHN